MTDLELIRHLSSLGVRLWVEGDALKFSAPKGALTDALKEQLRARKGSIRDFLRRASHEPSDAIRRVPRDREMPLSFAQERLWFLSRLDPADPSYTVPLAVRFGGALDVDALARALSEVVRRHEVLRATIGVADDRPVAVIHDASPLSLPLASLADVPAAERDAALRREINAEVRRPFDLAAGPLFRARLFALGDEDHVLAWTMHHIVTDGWSSAILAREIRALYDAFSAGRPSPLPDLAVQYVDYAAWQRDRTRGEELDRQLAYWKRELGGAPPSLDLPTDRPRPPARTYRGATRSIAISAEVSEAIADLARAEGATTFMAVLAAFDVLAHRYTGQDDIVVGSPVAGRVRPEIEGLIGFFVNTLVLRTRVDEGMTFRALLARVRETCLGAFAHQDVSFERLVQELAPARDRSRSPIFQVLVSMANAPAERVALQGLAQRAVGVDTGTSKFDLTLAIQESPRGLRAAMEYATDLFDAGTIDRMLAHFRAVLEGVAASPDAPVDRIPILSDAERRTLLVAWNDTAADYPRDARAHDLFTAQVERTPDAIAVVAGEATLTYRELDARSNKLARHLQGFGVGPEILVGICAGRSIDLAVAILGVLKAGGAYVPIDPTYPIERVAWMLEDSGAPIVVTQEKLADELPAAAVTVCIDSGWDAIDAESDAPVESSATASSLAYVIYTSGSTGRPKGALIEHRGLVNYLSWASSAYPVAEGRGAPVHSSIAFDLTITSLFCPLLAGRAAVLLPEEGDVSALVDTLANEGGYGLVKLTPAHLDLLTQLVPAGRAASATRSFVIGGDALTWDALAFWRKHAPGTRLLNEYGPTETVVGCCVYDASRHEAATGPVPIGRPIANTQLYVLDRHLAPVPLGVAGELYIGGVGVARGYQNRPELTAERFVSDPFSADPGARLYRTGDLVRYLPSGDLVFLGRVDHQIKIRGYRIELGEIESVLAQHAGVREAIAIAREDTPGDKRLVAYFVAEETPGPDAPSLRAFLAERLPEYMVPAAIVALDAMPLTANGKVDRKALPAPDARATGALAIVGPRNPIEEVVAGIWSDLLGIPQISVHDDFFELGGHSLLATQVGGRIASTFGVELPLSTLFDASTVASLSERVAAAMASAGSVATPPIAKAPEGAPRVLSFAEERLWFIDQLAPGDPSYVVPLAIHLGGALDADALDRAIVEVVRRHEVLRTTYAAVDGSPAPIVREAPDHILAQSGLRHLPEGEREAAARRAIAVEATRAFDLATGPLVRARLIELGDDAHMLLVSMHHIVTDAWSTGVLSREITALYEAFSRGMPSPLAELLIQYADYAAWQRAWLAGEVFDAQLAYWRDRLGGAPRALEIPTDRPRPPVPSHRGGRLRIALPEPLSAAIKKLSRERGATLFMTLLAGLYALLHRWSGQRDIVIGTPIAGRTRAETEGLIGLFINTLALRAELPEGATFAELIASARDAALGAYAHQDMPFERLVQELAPERDLGRSPIFQVVFVLQNAPVEPIAIAGTSRRGLAADTGTAKFDLTIALSEGARGIAGTIEYATDLFDEATVARFASHFEVLLGGVVSAPDAPLADIPILPDEERRRVVALGSATRTEYPRDATIHALFEAEAARAPGATAVSFGDASITYGDLDRRANQLARVLAARGVGAETRVGLFAKRSVEMIVATIAILKAGGAYVPLDADLPDARLAWIVADAKIDLVVAAGGPARQEAIGGARVLDLVSEAPLVAAESEAALSPIGSATSLAYVMYTSGSTGTPKGVCVVHRGVVRLVRGTTFASFDANEVFLQLAPIAFDASTLEIWGALLHGARLVVPPPDAPSLAQIGEIVRASGVTTLWLTAGLFNAMIDASAEGLRGLRRLLAGGEALSVPHVRRARRELPGVTLINGYGPTENTTFTCCHTITDADLEGAIPIGRPIANTTVYILDESMSPAPIGVPGELYTGGDGLARGYLDRPELTAERFVRDPFSDDPEARLYRTGDRARFRPDGTIDFLGRLDFQVKLRGFRIELGEIEAVLAQHPSVSACLVLLREDAPGDKRLVAYVAASAAPAATDLRAFLADRLPAYMVPSAFVTLDALPLTPNGKVDRRALPAPELAAEGGAPFVAPRGPIEETLAGIFSELLRIPADRVGAHDGFFELGGHSLLATQAVTRVRSALGVELPLRALFEAPTPAELASRVEAAMKAERGAVAPPIVPVPRVGPMPLSFAQERLWLIHELDPTDPSYVVPYPARFEGALDLAALERAIAEIVRRHEVLRTTYALAGGKPVAVIHDDVETPLPVRSLSHLAEDEREAALRAALAEEARRPYDLANGPALRAIVFELGPDDHVLHLAMHHIASDGWTIGVLAREITALYDAFSRGLPSPLLELPIQYADYAAWQRAWLAGDVLATQIEHSKRRLAGAPGALDLPTDRPRPPVPSRRGAMRPFALDAASTAKIRDLARREGATLFMVLLAALDVVLHRWSGQADILVGTPIAGRTRAEIEGLVGCFVNTLVMRAEIEQEDTFHDLLRRVREDALDAYAHQDTPFEQLVAAIEPDRDMSRSPLFQVMFVLQTAPMGAPRLGQAKRRGAGVDNVTAKFDLTLTLMDRPDGIAGAMELATDLFDPETIDRLLASYRTLLVGLAERVDQRIWELPILAADEERRLVAAAGGAGVFPVSACLHDLFEATVALTPDAIAATCDGQSIAYRDLDARSNQVARVLRKRGVGPEVLVGLAVDRSIDLLVGLLGILKAGGAYVPLDPEYPKDRLAFMIEDARVPVVITQARHASLLSGASLLKLDEDRALIDAEPGDRVESDARPESLAYVIYTSGSTGKPKGAMVEHRQVVRLFTATERWFGFDERDVWTMFHSYAFDFSVWEIWGALLYGGRVVIVPYWVSRSPEAFYELLGKEQVTVLSQTPSAFRQLVHAEGLAPEAARDALALRYVVFGGEALDVGELAPFWDRHGDEKPRLVNMYGITETTVHVTYRRVSRADLDRPWSSVIGDGIPDLSVHVLDAHRRPVPIGVPGEMYVGGAGVARGYLHRPELTTDRFLLDPWKPGGRLYRTGDLARRLANGDIEYLGRIDHQVKIRGFRIELGEIEAALDQHPSVRTAVVLAREDQPGDKRLVAYLVTSGAAPSVPDLRAFLKARLPEYMVPSAFVTMGALPLTSNGKIDRRALPAPESSGLAASEHVAPRGPVEEAIASIFAEVLRVPRVGARDGFFDLGGHSLLAVQAIGRIRDALGVDLPLRAVFEAPTVADLAARVSSALDRGDAPAAAAITRVPRGAPLALSFGQERLWVLDQLEPGDPTYVVPLTFRLSGPLDVDALDRALRELVRRHEVLRTTFVSEDGRPAQVVHERVDVGILVEDLRSLPEARRDEVARRAVAEEAQQPFDLARGPVIRARLFAVAEEAHFLSLAIHHIAVDEWSTGILLREIGTLYEAMREGRPSPLTDLPIQYADFAAWQRRWFAGDVADRALAYWRGALAGAPAVLDLPADRPRPAVQSHRGARRAFTVPADVASRVKDLAKREGATLFMTLLAGFAAMLHRYTGQGDLSIGTPVADRSRPETEGVVGYFLNTLVLRARPSGDASFRDLLGAVRETCLGAYAHQDMPFERLVQELDPGRDLGRSPLFQVLFTMNTPSRAARAGAPSRLRISGGLAEPSSAKFDLSLAMGETEGGELAGGLEYATDLFDAETIDRMAAHLVVLLGAASKEPDRPIGALPITTAEERATLLVTWNDRAPAFSIDACLHGLFEEQADRTPDAIAVIAGRDRVSYRELDRRANRVASRLRELGVGPEVLVGVCVERSSSMIAGILGVLKAGGAYVPVDPAYPASRIAQILQDARAPVLLTQASLASSLPEIACERVLLDEGAAALDAEPDARIESGAASTSLAYVIYTSGSTGRPKGVAIEHRSAVCLARWAHGVFAPEELSRVLFSTSICFDLSIFELFVPLSMGGAVVLAENALELPSLPAKDEVTLVNTVPTAMAELVRMGQVPRSVVTVCLAGEALQASLAEAVHALPHVAKLYNLYGPTEDTTYSTVSLVQRGATPDVGVPIAGGLAYILDARREPVPIGVPGEIYLGGAGLARGYLNRPDLTAERFVDSPFVSGGRIYRTGDLGRYRRDGTIEYLGRIDHQVKVRGFRIELGEIDADLLADPDVREAVTVARDDGRGKRLVAYVVPSGEPPTVGALRGFVRARLPEFMVPAAFVLLAELPLTPNGKIDRKALPAPDDGERPALDEAYAAPETAVEQALARIWATLLRRERVGVHDNFFELGGDSILGIQVVARAAHEDIRITPRQIFLHPTISALAAEAGVATIDAEQGPITGDVVATPIQRWWLEQRFADPHHWNQSFFFEVEERLDAGLVEDVVAALLDHHDALRMRLAPLAPEAARLAIAAPGGSPPVQRVDLAGVAGDARRAAIEQIAAEAQTSLDLASGPIVRVVLFDLGHDASCRLQIVIHHLAVDGVSWRILLEDFWTAYRQRHAGEPIRLPPKTTSWQRWAARLAEHARSSAIEGERSFWLSPSRARASRVPVDHARGESTEASARHIALSLTHDETEALLRRVPEVYRTQINDVLLTALASALSRWTGSSNVVVDVEGHGREELFSDVDLTRTAGWFTTLSPVAIEIGANAGPGESLMAVKEQLRAIPGRGLGYGLLRYLAAEPAELASEPRPDVVFNYLGQLDQLGEPAASVPRGDGRDDRSLGSRVAPAPESSGVSHSPRARRAHLLELNATVAGGRLHARWTYSEHVHRRATIESLASATMDALRGLIAHCLEVESGGATPSDFDKADLTQEAIDMLALLDPNASSE